MKRFKYDVVKLIEGVRDRPCLWNKNIENYKDRVERKMAWIEIFNILDERYEEMSSDDKRLTSETVLSKWTNIRDTFVKSLKSRAGRTKKQYVLYEHLKFLLQIIPECDRQDHDNLGYNEADDQSSFMKDESAVQVEDTSIFSTKTPKEYEILYDSDNGTISTEEPPVEKASKRKKSKKEKREETEQFHHQSNTEYIPDDDPRIMNEDEAFFASLLPTIVKYNEDERLEFRIEVLAVMKKIKEKRKWASDVII